MREGSKRSPTSTGCIRVDFRRIERQAGRTVHNETLRIGRAPGRTTSEAHAWKRAILIARLMLGEGSPPHVPLGITAV